MKKKQLNLGKKLLLNKDVVTLLEQGAQSAVLGGATVTFQCCPQSVPVHNTCFCPPTQNGAASCVQICNYTEQASCNCTISG